MTSLPLPARNAAIGFILVTAVLDIVALGIVIPVLPALIEEFSGSNARAGVLNGLLITLWAMAQFIASPIIGSLSDRFGRRPVILLSCAGLAADYVLMALAPGLWWLALGRIIAGVTASSFNTVYAYMADITPPEQRARAFGLIGAAFSGGFIAGPLIGGLFGTISPRAPFWLAAGLSAVAFLYGLLVLPESLARENRMAFSWRRANPFGALMLLASRRELFGLSAVTFLMHFAHHVFTSVFVLYASYRYGWGAWEVGLLLSLVGALDVVVQGVLVGHAVRLWGDRATMIMGLFGGAFGVACMGLAPSGLWLILAMIPNALWALAMPTLQALMTRTVSESEQGQLQGATMSLASVAGVLSPLFFGTVYAASVDGGRFMAHPGAAFFIAAGVLFAAAVIGWVVARGVNAAARSAGGRVGRPDATGRSNGPTI